MKDFDLEKRAILAIILSLLLLILYQTFFLPTPKKNERKIETEKMWEPLNFPKEEISSKKQKEKGLEKLVVVETDLYRAVFTPSYGGGIKSWKLKKYMASLDPQSSPIELVTDQRDGVLRNETELAGKAIPMNSTFGTTKEAIDLRGSSKVEELSFEGWLTDTVKSIKKFRFYPEDYRIDLTITLINSSAERMDGNRISLSLFEEYLPSKDSSSFSEPVYFLNDRLFKEPWDKIEKIKTLGGEIKWIAFQDKYFVKALATKELDKSILAMGKKSDDLIFLSLYSPINSIPPKAKVSKDFVLYFGPKEIERLRSLNVGLNRVVDFGWFSFIAKPLLELLKFFYSFTANYGVAIILLTMMIKLLFIPLTQKSFKSMKKMQKLQPKIAQLKEKYKNNPGELNKATMELYKTYKFNPFGGCLPMLLQMPVFIALYKALMDSIELRHAPFIFWIKDLSAKDPYYVTPILMGLTMFIQQKMTPSSADPTQAKLMMFMPLIFTFMFLSFPSGLVIYWLVNNVLSIGHQYYMDKKGGIL